jgi:hypothetical protein
MAMECDPFRRNSTGEGEAFNTGRPSSWLPLHSRHKGQMTLSRTFERIPGGMRLTFGKDFSPEPIPLKYLASPQIPEYSIV